MSSTSLLNLGSRALAANAAALQTTGNNIANVNTPGYSRQSVEIRSAGGQSFGQGFFGKGVELGTVTRAHSDYLTREAALSKALQAADSTRAAQLGQLEQVFPPGEDGLGAALSDMLNGFAAVASAPTDLSARTAVLSQVGELSARFTTAQARIEELQRGTAQQMQDAVGQVNQIARNIASLNDQISHVAGLGHTPNDLLDQRDQAISDLNKYVQTSSVPAADGTLSIFVGGSQPLVLGSHASTLGFVRDQFDTAQQRLAITAAGRTMPINEDSLGGGSIAGLLKFQNTDLVQGRDLLGRMALALTDQVNRQHALGLDLNGNPGGALLTAPTLPNGLPATTNTGNATLGVAVADSTKLAASDYMVNFNAGQIDVVRTSDGVVQSFASLPAQVDGLTLSIPAGAAQVGDRFLVRPLHDAAAQVRAAVSSPAALAVASPVSAAAGTGNRGTLAVTTVAAAASNANLTQAVTLTFNGAGGFDVSGTGTGNPTGVTYTPGQPITYNGWQLTLSGQPAAGDTITIGPNSAPRADAGNADSLLALRDLPTFDGVAMTDGYADLLAQVGARSQGAQSAATVSTSIAGDAEQARASSAGVNLDEEAARLLQFQQSYQAAAKVLQVAQSVFTTLLQTFSS